MTARERILERIRSAAGRQTPTGETAAQAYRESVGGTAPRPEWSGGRQERFVQRLEAAAATWQAVKSGEDLPEAAGDYLARHDIPLQLHVAPHPRLDALTWPESWQVHRGTDDLASARVTLSVARFGIAETGTLMIPGGGATPPSMNLLAEHHLVVLEGAHLVDYQEQAWEAYRRESGALPRAVMLITGPSRTADIEQTLQLGAHGPRNLHVLLLDEAAS